MLTFSLGTLGAAAETLRISVAAPCGASSVSDGYKLLWEKHEHSWWSQSVVCRRCRLRLVLIGIFREFQVVGTAVCRSSPSVRLPHGMVAGMCACHGVNNWPNAHLAAKHIAGGGLIVARLALILQPEHQLLQGFAGEKEPGEELL